MRRSTQFRARIPRGMLRAPRAGSPLPARPTTRDMPEPTIRQDPGQLALELPSALPTLGLEPEWKAQQRLWGHSLHPMCSYLASFPAALAHAFIARYSRPGDVVLDPFSGRGTAPVQAAAEGRIGVGNDLNPLAHVLTAAKLEPAHARRRHASGSRRCGSSGPARPATGSTSPTACSRGPGIRRRSSRPPGSGDGPDARTEAVPTEVSVAFHARTLAQLLLVRSQLRLDDRDGPLPRRRPRGHPARQDAVVPVDDHAQHVQHGAALRARLRGPDRLRAAGARRLRRAVGPSSTACTASRCPRPRASACSGDARTAGRRARAALRARGLPGSGPADRHLAALPARAQVRLLQLAADVAAGLRRPADRRDPRRRPPRASRTSRSCATSSPTSGPRSPTTASPWSSWATSRRTGASRRRPAIGLAEAVWEQAAFPAGYRLAGLVRDEVAANRKMTRLWGEEAGQATKTDRILVLGATEAGRRRALAAAGDARSTGPGRRRGCAPLSRRRPSARPSRASRFG